MGHSIQRSPLTTYTHMGRNQRHAKGTKAIQQACIECLPYSVHSQGQEQWPCGELRAFCSTCHGQTLCSKWLGETCAVDSHVAWGDSIVCPYCSFVWIFCSEYMCSLCSIQKVRPCRHGKTSPQYKKPSGSVLVTFLSPWQNT